MRPGHIGISGNTARVTLGHMLQRDTNLTRRTNPHRVVTRDLHFVAALHACVTSIARAAANWSMRTPRIGVRQAGCRESRQAIVP
jgi:hypothetical protein